MYYGYILMTNGQQSFNVPGFLERVAGLPYVTKRHDAPHEFLVTETPEAAKGLDELLAADPNAQLPPVAVVEVNPKKITVEQNVDREILGRLRPLLEILVQGVPFSAIDLEGQPIPLPSIDPLKPLFD